MAPILALGLLLAGCGSVDDTPTLTTSSPASAEAPAAGVDKSLPPIPASTASQEDLALAAQLASCKLVTKDELGTALGHRYRDPEPGVDTDSTLNQVLDDIHGSCVFWATENKRGGVGQVDVLVVRPSDPASAYTKLRTNYQAVPSAKDVAGLGDSAFQSGSVLVVRKGGALLETSVNWTSDDIASDRLRTVTELALARLP
jgi:hypothetical protein